MMYEVSGGTKAQRKVIDQAMSFVIDHITVGNVYVYIQLGRYASHGVMQLGSRTFEIEIVKDVSDQEILYTVCHEMKHVEQLYAKRLVYAQGKCLWLGEDHSNTIYFDRPWEVEAYKFEKIADQLLTSCAA